MEKIRFDGKHWIERRPMECPLKLNNFDNASRQASENLGYKGIVAVPNARLYEYRFEEFYRLAEKSENEIIKLGDGRVFYDSYREIYFMKAQEINTRPDKDKFPLTFLIYNLPFGENLNDNCNAGQVLKDASELECIIGINGPSCIGSLKKIKKEYPEKLNHLIENSDFFVGYSGSAFVKLGSNSNSLNFYDENINGNKFENSFKKDEKHSVGILSVSGGHRTPENFSERLKNGFSTTIGKCYVEMPKPDDSSSESFMKDMRNNLRNLGHNNRDRRKGYNHLHMEPIIAEMVFRHLPLWCVYDKLEDKFKKIFKK